MKEHILKKFIRDVGEKAAKVGSKTESYTGKKGKQKIVAREVVKDNETKINLRQKVYTKDKSRFFKTAWEEEKRQLFFD